MSISQGVVWQGFHHAWRYNHRLNRLGSYVQRTDESDPGWKTVHTAASGTGPDTAQFCDLYTVVDSPDVAFEATQAKLRLEGQEATSISASESVELSLDDEMAGLEEYAVVLNGFDIVAESDADKLMSLSVSVSEPTVPGDGTLSFGIDVTFEGDCGTPECSDPSVDYTCYVFTLVVGGDRDAFRPGPNTSASASYDWDLNTEPDRRANGVSRDQVAASDLWGADGVQSTVGITDLSVDLTKTGGPVTTDVITTVADLLDDLELEPHAKAMHFLELDLSIENVDTENGFETEFLTFYKNWTEGMKQLVPDDFLQDSTSLLPGDVQSAVEDDAQLSIHDLVDASIWAHRNAGEAAIELTGTVLQFQGADRVESNVVPGSIEWPGKNADAKSLDDAHYDVRTDTRNDEPGDARHETLLT